MQYEDKENNLYVSVTCPQSTCTYTIKFEDFLSTKIEPNSVYSYFVTKINNREMILELYGTTEEGSFITKGVKGSSTVIFSVDRVEKYQYIFDNIKILTFPIDSGESISSMPKFIIKETNIGEFLTVSAHAVTKGMLKRISYIQMVLLLLGC